VTYEKYKQHVKFVAQMSNSTFLNFFFIYWVVWEVRADFEGKMKRRRFKFLISLNLLNLNLLQHELSE